MQQYLFSKGQLPALQNLMNQLGLTPLFRGEIALQGKDPILASPHRLGEAVSTALLLDAVVASAIWDHRSGQKNNLSLNIHDAIHYLHPVHFVWQSGYNMDLGADKVQINFNYRCKDGRQVWLQCGPPYPKLQDGYLNFFNCGNNREAIAKVIAGWNAFELEEKLAELGLPCCVVRTKEEWRAHPQGQLLLNTPVIEIEKIAEGKPCGLEKGGAAPLAGVKVLDWTHVLAGPRSVMSLAEFGADVLYVAAPHHLDPKTVNLGVNHGKKSAFLDLESAEDLARMQALLLEADVFAQSYRPSVCEKFGLTPAMAAKQHPRGLVYMSINAFGHDGPWRYRPGFDQNAQMTSGFSATEGSLEVPKASPVYYINDLLTAYFAAAGMMTALLRRAVEGGSYHVKVSLTRSCMWAQDLGLIAEADYKDQPLKDIFPRRFTEDPQAYTYPPHLSHEDSAYGPLIRLAPAVQFSQMPQVELLPVVPYGSCAPQF